MSNLFWRRWLIVVMGGVMLYGLCLILFPQTMHHFFNILFFGSSESIEHTDPEVITLVYGVLGAVLIGWMVTLLATLLLIPATHQHITWQILALAIGVWFVTDTGFSLYTGFVAHALFNTGFLILFAIPLGNIIRRQRTQA
jgi:hypothetical protein